jgi:diaminopimelate decarboxylase
VLEQRFKGLRDAFGEFDPLVCFSVKSLANTAILRLLGEMGSGFDVVSGGELYRVCQAGSDPNRVVYAGVGKTPGEIEYALEAGIYMFNVESKPELELVNKVASGRDTVADVALRVNPDVDPNTHAKTTTGKKENKFGISVPMAEELGRAALSMPGINLLGLHVHLGSPIYSTAPYIKALEKIASLKASLEEMGCMINVLNIGGGFCMSYTGAAVTPPAEYADAMRPLLTDLDCNLLIEPGRHIAAPAGILAMEVVYRKETDHGKVFIICDGGMNDMLRPALYEAFHRIWPVKSKNGMPPVIEADRGDYPGFETEKVDVVGPVCESSDCFAKDRALPRMAAGETLAVFDAGAYGHTMSSQYNGRPRPPEVLVAGDDVELIRKRESYADLVRGENMY